MNFTRSPLDTSSLRRYDESSPPFASNKSNGGFAGEMRPLVVGTQPILTGAIGLGKGDARAQHFAASACSR